LCDLRLHELHVMIGLVPSTYPMKSTLSRSSSDTRKFYHVTKRAWEAVHPPAKKPLPDNFNPINPLGLKANVDVARGTLYVREAEEERKRSVPVVEDEENEEEKRMRRGTINDDIHKHTIDPVTHTPYQKYTLTTDMTTKRNEPVIDVRCMCLNPHLPPPDTTAGFNQEETQGMKPMYTGTSSRYSRHVHIIAPTYPSSSDGLVPQQDQQHITTSDGLVPQQDQQHITTSDGLVPQQDFVFNDQDYTESVINYRLKPEDYTAVSDEHLEQWEQTDEYKMAYQSINDSVQHIKEAYRKKDSSYDFYPYHDRYHLVDVIMRVMQCLSRDNSDVMLQCFETVLRDKGIDDTVLSGRQYDRLTRDLPIPFIQVDNGGAYANQCEVIQQCVLNNPIACKELNTHPECTKDKLGHVFNTSVKGSEKYLTSPPFMISHVIDHSPKDLGVIVVGLRVAISHQCCIDGGTDEVKGDGYNIFTTYYRGCNREMSLGTVTSLYFDCMHPDRVLFDIALYRKGHTFVGQNGTTKCIIETNNTLYSVPISCINSVAYAPDTYDVVAVRGCDSFNATQFSVNNALKYHPSITTERSSGNGLWVDVFPDGASVDEFAENTMISTFIRVGSLDSMFRACPDLMPITHCYMKGQYEQVNWSIMFKSMYWLWEHKNIRFYMAGVGDKILNPALGSIVSDLPQSAEFVNGRDNKCYLCHQVKDIACNEIVGTNRTLTNDRSRYNSCFADVNRLNEDPVTEDTLPIAPGETEDEYRRRLHKNQHRNVDNVERDHDIWSTLNPFLVGEEGYPVDEHHCVYGHMCIELMHNYWENTYNRFVLFLKSLLSPYGVSFLDSMYQSMIYTKRNRLDSHGVEYIVPYLHRNLPIRNSATTGKGRSKAFHRYALSLVLDVIIEEMLSQHCHWLTRLDEIHRDNSKVASHNSKCLFVYYHSKTRFSKDEVVPSEYFRLRDNRNKLIRLFGALHELGELVDSTSQHYDDVDSIHSLITFIRDTVNTKMKHIVKSFNNPFVTPSAHVFFAHAQDSFVKFGPLTFRKVDHLEGEQGEVRAFSKLTNRGEQEQRSYTVIRSKLVRCCSICWCLGGPIIPVTRRFSDLTPAKRHYLYVKLLADNVFVTGGPTLLKIMSDPSWNAVAERLSPFFHRMMQVRVRDVYAGNEKPTCRARVTPNGSIVEYKNGFAPINNVVVSTLSQTDVTVQSLERPLVYLFPIDNNNVLVMSSFDSSRLPHSVSYPCFVKYKGNDNWPHLGFLFLIFRQKSDQRNQRPVLTHSEHISTNDYCLIQEMVPTHDYHIAQISPSIKVLPQLCVCTLCTSIMCMSHVMRTTVNPPNYMYNRRGDYWCTLQTYHVDDLRCKWEQSYRDNILR